METGGIREAIAGLGSEIEEACRKAGRAPGDVRFILVTKTVGLERIRGAWEAGIREFGENRVQELLEKKEAWPDAEMPGVRWHMIGRLQTNKVRQILPHVVLIHSLDRLELAEEIVRQVRLRSLPPAECLIQVNSSGEETKAGFSPAEVEPFIEGFKAPEIRFRGLMTIGPNTEDETEIRKAFRAVRELQMRLCGRFPQHDLKMLSMGMSGDYRLAIEEGSTLLRIGSRVFGARPSA